MSADKTRFIRFAKAGGNKGERSQMVMSGWGKRSVIRIECSRVEGNGSESCFVAARNRAQNEVYPVDR